MAVCILFDFLPWAVHKLALLSPVNDHREGGSFAMIVGQLAKRVIDSLCVMFYGNINKGNKNTLQIDGEVNWANIVYDIGYKYYLLEYFKCLCVKVGHSHSVNYIVFVYRKRYSW